VHTARRAVRPDGVLEHLLAESPLRVHVDFESVSCPISGYLPLHAAVANGRISTYNLLVAAGVDVKVPTVPTRSSPMALTALQLACRLGDRPMLEHILGSRLQVRRAL
jgi:hypothetical protein